MTRHFLNRETKHVTIWFQNKRQMERKYALHNSTNSSNNRSSNTHRKQSVPQLLPSPPLPSPTRTALPSLDRIASRSELRAPSTPKRKHDPHASAWENMPSSPLGPPASPESVRETAYVEFGKHRVIARGRRTLEWACAAARVSGTGTGKENERGDTSMDLDLDDLGEGEETEEEEAHEAVTPNSSFTHGGGSATRTQNLKKATIQDEDMMAAYVLCGLGRR